MQLPFALALFVISDLATLFEQRQGGLTQATADFRPRQPRQIIFRFIRSLKRGT
jgi:hypothetical protein